MVTTLIIAATTIISIASFQEQNPLPYSMSRPEWFDKLKFNAFMVWHRRDFYRLFSSGLVHGGWMHLLFNMLTLYFFGYFVEEVFQTIFGAVAGEILFAVFYILALMVSSLGDLFKYREQPYYNAIGASGAVSAVLFAAILFAPKMGIGLFFIPVAVPGYVFGPLFLLYCHFMAKKNIDNIGHSAHFWGAVFGLLFPIICYPSIVRHFINQFG
ncbi:MAG: rhomboid family intramembrane serine protease [Bacteroidales bacterium]|nr:rhomboid family intramembrane serine protease [Bacteroidales bacterium]